MRISKYLFSILSIILIFASSPLATFAEESTDTEPGKYSAKDEVIYGNLNTDGTVQDLHVVNSFIVKEPGEIVDYGNYTSLRNLTDLSEIKLSGDDEVHLQVKEDAFFYQGELEDTIIPWDISITYLIDGEKVNPDQLAGESGKVEIQIATSANKDVDPLFYEHFLLQISLTLDPEVFDNIQAPKGTEANEGKNKQIAFTVLPDKDDVLIVSANVTNFEMDPIDISATPANIALEDPDVSGMTGDIETLSDAIGELRSGVASLSDGIGELSDGASELSNGSTTFRNGINELDQSSAELVNGSKEIRNVLREVSTALEGDLGIPDLDELEQLPNGLREIANGLRDSSGVFDGLDEAINEVPDISQEQLDALIEFIGENDPDESFGGIIQQLIGTYEGAQAITEFFDENREDLENFSEQSGQMADQLEVIATEIESNLSELDQLGSLADLQNGIKTLSTEYDQFHNGLVTYTEGVGSLAASYKDLDAGIKELSSGTASLKEGANELYEGAQELEAETSDLPNEIESQIDEFMKEYDFADFEPQSFVSQKNEKIEVVQFVLQTEQIEVKDDDDDTDKKEEKVGFWQRILNLFK